MKKLIFFLFPLLAIAASELEAQTNVTVGPKGEVVLKQINKDHALVDQREGIYIFILSKPQAETEYLGSVKKTGVVMTGSPDEMLKILLKRCKKDFPQAEAIIISDIKMEHADCVKFK
jgi:hypothetical protein